MIGDLVTMLLVLALMGAGTEALGDFITWMVRPAPKPPKPPVIEVPRQ